jgi:hypothetical protein
MPKTHLKGYTYNAELDNEVDDLVGRGVKASLATSNGDPVQVRVISEGVFETLLMLATLNDREKLLLLEGIEHRIDYLIRHFKLARYCESSKDHYPIGERMIEAIDRINQELHF